MNDVHAILIRRLLSPVRCQAEPVSNEKRSSGMIKRHEKFIYGEQ
jgi:hypothetical protein